MKKLLCMILSLALILSLAACGSSVPTEPEAEEEILTDIESPEAEKDETEDKAEEPEEAPGVKPEEKPEAPAQKPTEKPEAKPQAKPEAKPEVKPEVKPEAPAEKPAEKPEVKPEEKPEAPAEKPEENASTVGDVLASVWRENSAKSAEDIANAVISHSSIQFMGGVVAVEEGMLTGFDNTEIKGFSNGYMFAPAIGTIPFVGYVFELADGTDADAFVKNLKDSANPRWNICTQAEQTIVEKNGNKVFFLMCPKSFEE